MPFGPHVASLLEAALTDCFRFHSNLDHFLLRAGIPRHMLDAARSKATARANASTRDYSQAPKRFVVQELLTDLSSGADTEDRLAAGIITALCKGTFPDATPSAKEAIDALRLLQKADREEKAEKVKEQREEEQRKANEAEERQNRKARQEAEERERFKSTFMNLITHPDPQQRGYMLEDFLNGFLKLEGLNPRGSFKITGEQIDGSFEWGGNTHLVEARWVKDPVAGAGFSQLMYKIEGKSADTRGLFLSINGYSPEALVGLKSKGELRFVCIDGAHLLRCLHPGGSFVRVLEAVWRHASEEGNAYLPVSDMNW
jgi:hypothetical protein